MSSSYGQLQDRGFVRGLQTRFSLNPDFSLSLTPEVTAVIPFDAPEVLYHQGWRRWQVGKVIPAVAAAVGRFQIRNPDATATNPGALVIVESISASAVAASEFTGDFGYGPAAADLATLQNAEFRDGRQTPSANSMARVSNETGAIVVSTAVDLLVAANTPVSIPGAPWVLLPGNVLLFSGSVVNSGITYTIVWRERLIQEQENTP